jgi:DNA-3-methyladenine glycosylase I
LFEHFTLSGQQVGLSWWTILSKREAYQQAFHCFDIDKVASMSTMDVDEIMSQESKDKTKLVVRNPCKLRSVIHNAKLIQTLKANGTISSFSEYLWSFVDDKPILNRLQQVSDLPIQSKESMRMGRALKKHGFKYVGPTTMYAMMQSCGLVMDYIVGSKHLAEAEKRLKNREGGYQIRYKRID